ncbi:hypothetical protein KEM56_002241 [Ascosphaera pollenicola]|nr:hypothetical protein KEM56_002241 [Ascosphaera pollenicola]
MHGLDFLLFGLLASTARAFLPLKRSELLYRGEYEQDTLNGNSGFKFGLQKIRKAEQELPPILKADKTKLPESVPLNNDGHDTSYIIEAKIGPRKQKLDLLLDSGAPNTWVMKSDCQTDACKMHSTFDSNKPTSGSFKVNYGTGNVHGDYINETIAIGGLNVNFTFGSVLSASQEFMNYPIDGILGIGYAKANQNPPSFMQSVIADKILDQNVIGINLFRHNEKKHGEVVFGGVDKSRISGDITYSEVVDDAYDWRIPFEGFSVDDNSVKYDKKMALVDTGTSYILAPKNDVAKLHGYVKGSKKVTDKNIQASYTVPCGTKSKLQLAFSGTNFTVSPKDYIGVPSTKDGPDCYSNIVEQSVFGDDVWLMGDTLIKNIYVVFDWDKSRIGEDAPFTVVSECDSNGGYRNG